MTDRAQPDPARHRGLPSRARLVALCLLLAALAGGCGRGRVERGAAPDSARVAPAAGGTGADEERRPDSLPAAAEAEPGYGRFVIASAESLRALERALGPGGLDLVLRLNRVDPAHARQGDTLIVPPDLDEEAIAPFPGSLEAARPWPRLLLVSARVQAFAAYEAGRRVKWGPVSTGRREMPTPPGLYHANWKQRSRASTFNDEWVLKWYVNLANFSGISLHQYELPGRPASHSCVRLLDDDAAWLYGWVETWTLVPGDRRRVATPGTPVVVLDEYAFDQARPWRRLPEDRRATEVSADSIGAALARWLAPADTMR
jgi:hypothetical protein